jgi:hypothetical protein
MTITIEAIKAEHTKVAEMIATFERQAATTVYNVAAASITLAPGERYAGLILGKNGEADYHLILLTGEVESVNWEDAGKWAKDLGGDLPTRREQSLLFANLKSEFQSAWYWSNQTYETNSGYAWCQGFGYGTQGNNGKDTSDCRARAVRRLPVEA